MHAIALAAARTHAKAADVFCFVNFGKAVHMETAHADSVRSSTTHTLPHTLRNLHCTTRWGLGPLPSLNRSAAAPFQAVNTAGMGATCVCCAAAWCHGASRFLVDGIAFLPTYGLAQPTARAEASTDTSKSLAQFWKAGVPGMEPGNVNSARGEWCYFHYFMV